MRDQIHVEKEKRRKAVHNINMLYPVLLYVQKKAHSAARHSTAAKGTAPHRTAPYCSTLGCWAICSRTDLSWAYIVIQQRSTWYVQTWCSSTGTYYKPQGLRWFESRCHRGKKVIPIKNRYIFETKIDQVEQEIKEKLDRSASKLDHPSSEMPGMHQPSAFSTTILVSNSIAALLVM